MVIFLIVYIQLRVLKFLFRGIYFSFCPSSKVRVWVWHFTTSFGVFWVIYTYIRTQKRGVDHRKAYTIQITTTKKGVRMGRVPLGAVWRLRNHCDGYFYNLLPELYFIWWEPILDISYRNLKEAIKIFILVPCPETWYSPHKKCSVY
jgi:hypothetical protein